MEKMDNKYMTSMNKFYQVLFLSFILIGLASFCYAEDLGTQCATISDSTIGCPTGSAADCKILL
jgi:hypothetical protein